MTTPDVTIQLDRKHRAIRSGDRWALTAMQSDGTYDLVEAWDGPRRSIFARAEARNIVPSREAERQLALLPERRAFRADE